MGTRYLIIFALAVAGCASAPKPLPSPPSQPLPKLSASLSEPCQKIPYPGAADFDVWQKWMTDVVLRAYGDCAARHAATVKAWPQ